jgi:hypothetical protein
MQDSKFILLLKQIDSRAQKRFEDFISSPYFNKHKQVAKLGQLLIAQAPSFDHSRKMSKQYLYQQLYPHQKYDDNFFASLVSKLQNLLYKFLALELEDEEEIRLEILQLRALRLYKLPKHYKSAHKRTKKLLQKAKLHTATAAKLKADLFYEEDRWFLEQGGRQYDPALQNYSDQLDLAFFTKKLEVACDMLNRNIVVQANYQPSMLTEIEQKLNEEDKLLEKHPILRMYLLVLDILREEKESSYQALRNELQLHSEALHEEEQRQLFDYGLNFCVKQINAGKTSYYEEVLYLYRLSLARKLIYIDGYLPAWEYKNITTAALRTGRFDWVLSFLEDYKEKLSPDARENAYLYNLASYYYASGQQMKALQTLQNVEFTDRTYHIGAKIIQLKSYYELSEWDALEALIDAFNAYLRRNKEVSAYRKKANKNLLDLTKKLMRLSMQKDWMEDSKFRQKLEALQQSLKQTSPLASKDWLEEKVGSL